jgi:glycosyltransferase involved in cell wall biosynthesis
VRFLLIANHTPHSGYGTGQRLATLHQALARLGEVKFLWVCPSDREPTELPKGVDYCVPGGVREEASRHYWIRRHLSAAEFREFPAAARKVEELCAKEGFDLALCSFFRGAAAAPLRAVPCLLDVDCIPEPDGVIAKGLWPLSRRVMAHRAAQFSTTFVIRRADANLLNRGRTRLLPALSATAGEVIETAPQTNALLFVGNATWPPNQDAIRFLVEELAPELLLRAPDLRVRIVGGGTENVVGCSNVSAGGFVSDLRAEYRNARLVLCPVFFGGGANVKLAEALQVGAACVATEHAADGFTGLAVPGRDLLVASSRRSFIETVLSVAHDTTRLDSLRQAAARLSRTLLNQDHINAIVEESVQHAMR